MDRFSRTRRSALLLAVGALATAGCAGENLFSLSAAVGELGPDVSITAPTANATIAPGDSIRIAADITAASGLSQIAYSGAYASGTAAYTAETATINDARTSASVSNYLLAAAGQTAGVVYIVVEATDVIGGTGKDSVKVTIVQN